jgi:hypothetical protein
MTTFPQRCLSFDMKAGGVVLATGCRGTIALVRLQHMSRLRTMDNADFLKVPSVARHLLNDCSKPRHAASPWLI